MDCPGSGSIRMERPEQPLGWGRKCGCDRARLTGCELLLLISSDIFPETYRSRVLGIGCSDASGLKVCIRGREKSP